MTIMAICYYMLFTCVLTAVRVLCCSCKCQVANNHLTTLLWYNPVCVCVLFSSQGCLLRKVTWGWGPSWALPSLTSSASLVCAASSPARYCVMCAAAKPATSGPPVVKHKAGERSQACMHACICLCERVQITQTHCSTHTRGSNQENMDW